jgi:hypothetical protein
MCVSARLYNCARCHCQVTICRYCDRGNLYCGGACAGEARKESLRRSSASYQSSRRGRAANAQRQNRFRQRQREKVTHHGSNPDTPDDLLPVDQDNHPTCHSVEKVPVEAGIYCHFCHRACDPFLRNRFLRPLTRYRRKNRGRQHGY